MYLLHGCKDVGCGVTSVHVLVNLNNLPFGMSREEKKGVNQETEWKTRLPMPMDGPRPIPSHTQSIMHHRHQPLQLPHIFYVYLRIGFRFINGSKMERWVTGAMLTGIEKWKKFPEEPPQCRYFSAENCSGGMDVFSKNESIIKYLSNLRIQTTTST